MATGKKTRPFSNRNGRRDWDETDEEYTDEYDEDEAADEEEDEPVQKAGTRRFFSLRDPDEDEDEEDEEEDERPSRKGSFFASVKKRLASRKNDEDDEDEDDEDDEDEAPASRHGQFSLSRFLPRKKAEQDDYDYDFDDGAEESADYEDQAVEEYALPEEESEPTAEIAEEYYFEDEASEYAEEAEEYAYDEDYAEEAIPEEEESYDPFAALSYRAANPEAEEVYEDDFADEAYEEDYASEEEDEYAYGADEDEAYDDFEEYGRRSARHSSSSRGLNRLLMPALAGIAVLAVAAIAFASVTLLSSPKYESAKKEKAPAAESTPAATEEPVETAAPAESEQSSPASAAAASAVSLSDIKARRDTNGRIVPDVGGAVVPVREKKRSNDDFVGSTMIGNSFVEGMDLWSDLDTLKYVCADGVSLDNMIGNYLYYVTVQNYDSIYLCLGLNEIGWPIDTFITKYENVIDYIRSDGTSKTKNATIYITSVMPVEEIMETVPGESGSTISKATILEFNERLKAMCQEKGCWFLDVYSALADESGYLPDNIAADDHIHFEKTGYRIWTDYIRDHYVDEELLGG